VIYARQRRFAEAEATFQLAVRLNPNLSTAVWNLIQVCLDQRKLAAAEEVVRDAIRHQPAAEDLRIQLAIILTEMRRYDEAEPILKQLVEANPTSVPGWNRLGFLYGSAGRLEEAAECFREQVRLAPTSATGHANLAAALGKMHRWAEAAEAGREAVRLEPGYAPGWGNLGNALRDLGRLDEAVHALHQAIQLNPSAPEPYGNLALSLAMSGKVQEALPWYERAIQARSDNADVRFNSAVALLSLGDYDRGWAEYEWRWRTDQMKDQPRRFPCPVWDGSPPAGKTILVHSEQGIGDTFQFARFVTELAALGATVVLQAPASVVGLLRTCPGVKLATSGEDRSITCDFYCPLMSLPRLLRTRVDTIPNRVPYLTAPPEAVSKWRDKLSGVSGFKVGIVWRGNPKHIGDRWRSVRVAHFAPLAEVPGVTLVGLQKGPGSEQLSEPGAIPVLELGSQLEDNFGDTAGLVMNLDLVVAVDTAVVHLAGALGRPVWVALPLNADWRWLRNREDSPWYPTARLFRQPTFGDWKPVFERMAGELRKEASNYKESPASTAS
jgi:tetratricopeptide (TPR) repeat protein